MVKSAMQSLPPAYQREHLVFQLGTQLFCLSIDQLRGVFRRQQLTRVPMAPSAVAGVLNWRGHIVTAIDARKALDINQVAENDNKELCVVVEYDGSLYGLLVDRAHEVMRFSPSQLEQNPALLTGRLRALSRGIFKGEDELIICLDTENLFKLLQLECQR